MVRVDLYVESDSISQRSIERRTAYVLEFVDPQQGVRTESEGIRSIGTYHAVILAALNRAFGRMRMDCEVHIHTQDGWVMVMLEKNLKRWAASDFLVSTGKLVAHSKEWKELYRLTMRVHQHLMVPETGIHAYYDWMQAEMKRSRLQGAWNMDAWTELNSR